MATDAGAAAPGGAAAADPGVGAGPGPAVDLATAAPSLGLALARGLGPPPSPGRREDPSPSRPPCPDPARGLGPGHGPGVPRPCPRGSPSPGRGPRAPPSLLKRREPCPLKQTMCRQATYRKPGGKGPHAQSIKESCLGTSNWLLKRLFCDILSNFLLVLSFASGGKLHFMCHFVAVIQISCNLVR